jgi:hypothetical protein
MNVLRDEPPTKKATQANRQIAFIVGGMGILGILGLIILMLFSSFPGPREGSSDKSTAPPEDVSKAKP